jgi:hypothetical protein
LDAVVTGRLSKEGEHAKAAPSIARTSVRSTTMMGASRCEMTASLSLKSGIAPDDRAVALYNGHFTYFIDT